MRKFASEIFSTRPNNLSTRWTPLRPSRFRAAPYCNFCHYTSTLKQEYVLCNRESRTMTTRAVSERRLQQSQGETRAVLCSGRDRSSGRTITQSQDSLDVFDFINSIRQSHWRYIGIVSQNVVTDSDDALTRRGYICSEKLLQRQRQFSKRTRSTPHRYRGNAHSQSRRFVQSDLSRSARGSIF